MTIICMKQPRHTRMMQIAVIAPISSEIAERMKSFSTIGMRFGIPW